VHSQAFESEEIRRRELLIPQTGKMQMTRKITRRAVLRHGMHFSLGGTALLGLGACSGSDEPQVVCNEPGQLSNSDQSMRTSLGYKNESPDPQQVCGGCEYFTASDGACGSCELLPGQVSSGGRCDSWSAKS
jgi:hypothetical protein